MVEQAWSNQKIGSLLRRIGDMLSILGENQFRVLAYHRAADSIETLGEEVYQIWSGGRLREIPGVGEALAGAVGVCERSQEWAKLWPASWTNY